MANTLHLRNLKKNVVQLKGSLHLIQRWHISRRKHIRNDMLDRRDIHEAVRSGQENRRDPPNHRGESLKKLIKPEPQESSNAAEEDSGIEKPEKRQEVDPLDPNAYGEGPLHINEADRKALDNAIMFLELVRKSI